MADTFIYFMALSSEPAYRSTKALITPTSSMESNPRQLRVYEGIYASHLVF